MVFVSFTKFHILAVSIIQIGTRSRKM